MQISADEFAAALRALDTLRQRPGDRQMEFIRAHYVAPGRAATASALAESAGYNSYSAVNLHYGKLAGRIARQIGRRRPKYKTQVELLVDLVRPPAVTNSQWVLVMKPEFAEGLKRAGWV